MIRKLALKDDNLYDTFLILSQYSFGCPIYQIQINKPKRKLSIHIFYLRHNKGTMGATYAFNCP